MADYSTLLAQVYAVVITLLVVVLVNGAKRWFFHDRPVATSDQTVGDGAGDTRDAQADDAKDSATPADPAKTAKPTSDTADSQAGVDGKPSDKTEDKPKEAKAPARSAPPPNAVTPQSLQAEVQACHKDVKALASSLSKYMDDVPEQGERAGH